MKKIIVTGANGNLGQAVTRKLLDSGNHVLAIVRNKSSQSSLPTHANLEVHVADLADACYFLMQNYNEPGLVNVGVGDDISISDLALLIKDIVGYKGEIKLDASKPDGTPRKLMDVSKIKSFGWEAKISLRNGIEMVYRELMETNILNVVMG